MMKATLDIVLFLVTSVLVGAGTAALGVVGICAASGGACWWVWRRHRRRRCD